MDSKSPLLSKTIWANVLMLASAFIPQVQQWMQSNPEGFTMLITIVNIALRFISQGKLEIK